IKYALSLGCRHFFILIEKDATQLSKALIDGKDCNISRKDIFITTRISENLGFSNTEEYLDKLMKNLQTDYIDLLLLQYKDDVVRGFPRKMNHYKYDDHNRTLLWAWQILEKLYLSGKCKYIGVSGVS